MKSNKNLLCSTDLRFSLIVRLSKYLYFFVLKYFGVRFKTNSAVLLIKNKNPRTAAVTFFEIQFTLKGFSPLSLIFLRRKKFQKGLLINYLYNLLVFINFFLFINLAKGFLQQFPHSKTFTLVFCESFDLLSDVYPKALFYCFVFGSTTLTFVCFSLELT